MKVTKKPYNYLQKEFNVEDWNQVMSEFNRLEEQIIDSKEQLENYIYHYNELLDEINNKDVQNYVLLSTDTANEELEKKVQSFTKEIMSKSRPRFIMIEKKIYDNKYLLLLDERFDNYKEILRKNIKTSSEVNLPLIEKEQALCLKYRKAISSMTVIYEGEERTLGQMQNILTTGDAKKREGVWKLIKGEWLKKKKDLNYIFDELKNIRNEIAINCGLKNFGEYQHLKRNRFDYSLEDLRTLHDSIEKIVIPVLKKINECKKEDLKVDKIYPWDEQMSTSSNILKPFDSIEDLLNKNFRVLEEINSRFAEKFDRIKKSGNLDLDIRKGKTPGGFCFPIDRAGICFICMNVAGRPIESNILIHESGHGIHSLSHPDEPIREYRMFDGPGELAELPAKTMELLALDYYHMYYNDLEDIKQAKKERFIDILVSLRRYIMTDALEQWIYTYPGHTADERTEYFKSLEDRFNVGIEWTDLDEEKGVGWYRSQLMIIEPLYVISYALAQLGALAIYRNYKKNKTKTTEDFEGFLKLGFSKPIGALYEEAGIKFDFSEDYLKEIIDFIVEELEILQ